MQFLLDKMNTVVNTDLIDRINRTIEAGTNEFEYLKMVEPPVVLRDTTGSLPENAAGPFWIREAGEKWELTALKFRELHSMRTASLAAPLDGVSRYTLWHELSMGKIVVDLHLSVSTITRAAPHTCTGSETEVDNVIMTLGATDLHLGISTMLAIDETKMNELQAGQFFNGSLSCLASTIHTFEFTAANFSVGSFIKPTLDKDYRYGKLEHPVFDLIGPGLCVAEPLLNMIATLAVGPSNGGINMRVLVNDLIREHMAEFASDCEAQSPVPPPFFDPHLNFQTAQVRLPVLNETVNVMEVVSKILNESVNPAKVNAGFPGVWTYTRSDEKVGAGADSEACSKPCGVEHLDLCSGSWNGHPIPQECSVETFSTYPYPMYSDQCGRSCSVDPNVVFELFQRPQNSSVTDSSIPADLGVLGEVSVEVSNLVVSGLNDTLSELDLFNATDKYTITNSGRLFSDAPFRASVDIKVKMSGMKESLSSTEWPPVGLDTDFTLTFSARDIEFAFAFILRLRPSLLSLKLVDFFNADCAIRVIEDMLPTVLKLNITEVGLDVVCRKCTLKMWEWEARTKSQPNLQHLTDSINAFIQGYAEHFEVEQTGNGTLAATAMDKVKSDEKMRLVYSTLLARKQGYVDGRFSVSDRAACAGIVDRHTALHSNSTQRCGVLEVANSEYHAQPTFDLQDADAANLPPACSGVGQQCVYTCYPEHHLIGRDVLETVGVATCLETGEYADALPCVLTEEPVLQWWRDTKEPLGVEVMVLGGIVFAMFITLCCSQKRRVRRETKLKPGERDQLHDSMHHHSVRTRHISSEVSKEGRRGHRSLLRNQNLLLFARVCVPLLLALIAFFFVLGHTFPMMSVDIDVQLFGRAIKLSIPAFDTLVSRANGINGISIGEVIVLLIESPQLPWALLIIVGGLSGVWPYAQLALMSLAWVLPPTWLRPKKRGQWLLAISWLGKWSFIYLYVCAMIMLAFHVAISSPDLEVLPPELWHIDVSFIPGHGLAMFTVASCFALLVNNLAVYLHLNALTREHRANLSRSQKQTGSPARVESKPKQPTSYSKLEAEDTVEAVEDGFESDDTGSDGRVSQTEFADLLQREASAAAAEQVSWIDSGTLDVLGVRSTLVHSRE